MICKFRFFLQIYDNLVYFTPGRISSCRCWKVSLSSTISTQCDEMIPAASFSTFLTLGSHPWQIVLLLPVTLSMAFPLASLAIAPCTTWLKGKLLVIVGSHWKRRIGLRTKIDCHSGPNLSAEAWHISPRILNRLVSSQPKVWFWSNNPTLHG